MPVLWLDLETFSDVPIAHGTYKYAENSEVMAVAWAIDAAPSQVWDVTKSPGSPPPELLRALQLLHYGSPEWVIYAHNVQFDRNIMRLCKNWRVPIPIERWRCSMVQAMEHGLPGGLDKLCTILGVPEDARKLKLGRSLIHLFCKPRPKNQILKRATRLTHPDEWALFCEYARTDIDAMRECVRRLPSWNYPGNATELKIYALDQVINDRGAHIDVALVDAALTSADREKKRLASRAATITGGAVEATTQRDKLIAHIASEYGYLFSDLRADTVEQTLKRASDMPEILRELLVNRQQASQTSPAKYSALRNAVCADGRLRGVLQMSGAMRTRRWAGRVFQPQNLLRTPKYLKAIYELAISIVKRLDADLVFADVMEVLAALVRAAIVASPGKLLRVADLSNIEGRMLAWLAGEEWKLRAFADFDAGRGEDLYVLGYSRSFNTPIATVKADEEAGGTMRLIGKVQELALGYQGAVGAFQSMAAVYGVQLSEESVLQIVRAWRAANRQIVNLWYQLEDVVRFSILNPGQGYQCGRLKVRTDRGWLRIKLPSGGFLCYPHPEVDADRRISYMGVDSYTHQWKRLDSYGGKLAENVTQAEARNLFAGNLPLVQDSGYDILLHVHDEVISETDIERGEDDHLGLARLLATNPAWAPDLPLAAAGYSAHHYRKG